MLERYSKSLKALERRNLRRELTVRQGIDFSSNDYLGLSEAPTIRQAVQDAIERGVPIGATGSRLLRGNHEEHERLEDQAASFFGAESCLYMGGGYLANFAVLSTLPQQGDLLLYDALIHASCHEGLRAGKATAIEVLHNNPQSIEDEISRWRASHATGNIWIVVESLYSMDGDKAPLDDIIAIANRHNAFVVIDEAHATGVYGPQGRGLAVSYEGQENIICIHTCGKALGAHGALICAPKILCDYIVNRSRPFIYATAPSPLMAVAVQTALTTLITEPERQTKLHQLIDFTNQQLQNLCGVNGSESQIIPIVIGRDGPTMALAKALQEQGFDIRGIRQPTVPAGSARLRIALTLHVDQTQVISMLKILAQELEKI